jgi:hypothetical protein
MRDEWRSSGKSCGYWYPDTYGPRFLKFFPDSEEVIVSANDKHAAVSSHICINIPIAVLTELLADAGYTISKEDK